MFALYLSFVDSTEDEQKFIAIYNEYKKLIKKTALKILNNDSMAEDATHDTFCQIASKMNKIEDIYSDETKRIIYLIAKSTAKEFLKKEKRMQCMPFDENIIIEEDEVFSSVYVKELTQRIIDLPDIYKDVLELKVYLGFNDKEIADILKIKEATVRKRIQRARNFLGGMEK